jgi:hypothetical protein
VRGTDRAGSTRRTSSTRLPERLHRWAALGLVALIPLAPVAMFVYAKAAGADRSESLEANEQLLESLRLYPGSRAAGPPQHYESRAWDGEELVPIESYRSDFYFGVPRETGLTALIRHFDRQLGRWERGEEFIECETLGGGPDCPGGRIVTYQRGGDEIVLDTTDLATGLRGSPNYGLYVSQAP